MVALLLFPLAVPAYVGAYALVDFLDYSGALQVGLRAAFGWENARDYWFPEIRSPGAAIIVLAAALNPYVYLLARAAFREQSGCAYEVARALGAGPWGMFWRVGLPLARPAVAAGVALAAMETVADFGTVTHFGVQTLTTGIFTEWQVVGNAGLFLHAGFGRSDVHATVDQRRVDAADLYRPHLRQLLGQRNGSAGFAGSGGAGQAQAQRGGCSGWHGEETVASRRAQTRSRRWF